MRGESGGATRVVNDIADFAFVIECDSDHVMEANVGIDGDFDRASKQDVRMAKDAVDAETPGFVAGDGVGNFVRGPAVDAGRTGIAWLVGWVVRNFRLVEISSSAVAVP